jgi:hypothetical protein
MNTPSSSRYIRRKMTSSSRRGITFLRRASLGGVVATTVFAAGEATDVRAADIILPPNVTIGV